MTTLQLARRIADGAVRAFRRDGRRRRDMIDAPTQAVLQVLVETDSWFCRLPGDRLERLKPLPLAERKRPRRIPS